MHPPEGSFTAKYRGHCDACDSPIEIGDLAFYHPENELVHVRCPLERPVLVCNTCHMTKPCECEDR